MIDLRSDALILLVDNYDSFVWNLDHALRLASRAIGPESDVRVVRNDASVCGTDNPIAFAKLHGMLALHFGVRDSMADAHGQALTSRIEQQVIDRLRARFPSLAGQWPPAEQ